MKVLKNLSLMVLLVLVFAGCRGKNSQLADFDKQLYAPEYTSGSKIERADGRQSVLISVTNPWQGADSVTTRLFISRNGEPVPEGFDGQVPEGDAQRIVAMSSTHIAMLDAIGETTHVIGVSGLGYISSPDIQARRDSIGDVSYEGNINYELLLSLDFDLVPLSGVNGASAMESKLKELDIPFMYVSDYLKESPLGKAEWLVALSEVVGRRAKSEKVFVDIPTRYNVLKQKVSSAVFDAPSVMLNTSYGDSWFMPSTENYTAQLIIDAEGDCICKKNTGNSSTPIDLEEAYLLASEADMWLNASMANTLDELKVACLKFADTRCVRSGYVYNNNARTNAAEDNDYYESAVVNSNLLLRDLVRIFHPELVEEDFVHYKQPKQMRSRPVILFTALSVLTVGLFLSDSVMGAVRIPVGDAWVALTGGDCPRTMAKIVLNIRPIKAVVALLIEAALLVSGLQMQTLFRNPPVGSYVLGVSSGASLGVAFVVLAGVGSSIGIAGTAWLDAAVVLLVVAAVGHRIKDIMVILILGMMFSSGVSAVVQILQYLSKEEALKAFVIWTVGSFDDVTVPQLVILLPSVIVGSPLAVWTIKPLNLLLFGEEYAITMGLNIRRSHGLLFLSTTLLAGTVTAFRGPIGFIGPATPHVARILFCEADHRMLLPGTLLSGAAVLLLCNIVSKMFTLPVNAITALLGIPIVVWVVLRNKLMTVR